MEKDYERIPNFKDYRDRPDRRAVHSPHHYDSKMNEEEQEGLGEEEEEDIMEKDYGLLWYRV